LSTAFASLTPPTPYEGDSTVAPYNNQVQLSILDYHNMDTSTYTGSAYMVSPQMGITAAHVVFDELDLHFHAKTTVTKKYHKSGAYTETEEQASIIGWSAYSSREKENPGDTTIDKFNVDCAIIVTEKPVVSTPGILSIGTDTLHSALSSSRPKMLLGYPMDNDFILPRYQWTLHVTQAGTDPLTKIYGTTNTDSEGWAWQLYESTKFLGVGGNSGGPLMVENPQGTWEAAAILVGGNSKHSIVRAFDEEVESLINYAQEFFELHDYSIPTAPQIIAPPQSVGFLIGQDYGLLAISTQDPSTRYQWYKDGKIIPSATSNFLPLPNISEDDIGSYFIRVTNNLGTVDSISAGVNYADAPSIIVQSPSDVYCLLGQGFSLFVMAESMGEITYQWYQNDIHIDGGTSRILDASDLTTEDAGVYHCRVSSITGSTNTEPTTIHISGLTNFSDFEIITAELGETLTLDPGVYNPESCSIQWFLDDAPLEGETSPTLQLNLDSYDQEGTYSLRLYLEQLGYDNDLYAGYGIIIPNPFPPLDYDSWLDQYQQTTQRAPTEDPDSDHYSNLMEFYFGTDPSKPDTPNIWMEEDLLKIAINRQAWTDADDPLPFKIEVSQDLITWTEVINSPWVDYYDGGQWAELNINTDIPQSSRYFVRFSDPVEE